MEPYETYEHEGIPVEIHYQEYDQEHANPREGDQLTTMVCWHPDYVLGDEQIRGARGAVETPFDHSGRFESMDQLRRYIGIVKRGVCIQPLYLLDHSGLAIRTGRFMEDSQGWDTTMVGFVYTTHERITELCGDGEPYHSDEWIAEQVANDVSAYNDYLHGSVYGFVVAPGRDDEEQCWCYLGDPDKSGCKDEANATAAGIAKARREARAHPWLPTFGNQIQKAVTA